MNKFRFNILSGSLLLLILFPLCLQSKVPEIKVKVADYSGKFSFSVPEGGNWEFEGKSGRLKSKDKCIINSSLSRKAVKKFHVIVESVALKEKEKLDQALEKWRKTGKEIHTIVVGKASYAPDGVTISYDGRVCFIGVGVFNQKEPAQKLADTLAAEAISNWVFEEVITPSSGVIELRVNGKRIGIGKGALEVIPRAQIKLEKVEYAKGYSWHGFENRIFAGKMKIVWGAQDSIDCILHTDLESLLAGVVPSEISSKADLAALQAQAVAARGEIFGKISLSHYNEGFDCCAEQHCQVFAGERPETPQMKQKIAPTKGIMLYDKNGDVVDAVYAANCGGHGEPNYLVWTCSQNPILAGVWDTLHQTSLDLTKEADLASYIRFPPDCYCADAGSEGGDKFRWKKTLGANDWQEVEKKAGVGKISDISNFKRGPSGRLYSITVFGENEQKTVIKELAIRKLFGGLRSACFIVSWKKNSAGFINGADFLGAGWGHGVGMCQTGAQNMAKRGFKFNQILAHYFPGSLLKRAY
ncbi:MAG: SpoIID/LytB domain-containing protein [Candidatus Riflebacteria bacterium]|nr:SpoIID/LytB domain-containing protein [Candidatus Riflebacteria bacterium]